MYFHFYIILIFTAVYCQFFLDALYVGCYKWKRLKKKDLGIVVQCFIARMKDGFRKEDLSIDEIGESTSNNKVSFIHFLPMGKARTVRGQKKSNCKFKNNMVCSFHKFLYDWISNFSVFCLYVNTTSLSILVQFKTLNMVKATPLFSPASFELE